MTTKLLSVILLLTPALCTFGQDTTKQNLFLTGIYLENFHATIPWDTDYKNITSVGNPNVDTSSKGAVSFTWESVKILNGININLRFSLSRREMKKHKPLQVITFYGTIADSDIKRIKRYSKDYYNNAKNNVCNIEDSSFCYWQFNGCNMHVGQRKSHHGQLGYSFFDIQKSFQKQNAR